MVDVGDTRTIRGPVFHHRQSGIRALDETCIGLPVGALTQVTGRHANDVDLLIDALRRADPDVVVLDVQYEIVTTKYRSVVEELRKLHGQAKPVIIRCSPPANGSCDFDGEEAVVRALGVVAKIYPRPVVLAWCGRASEGAADVDALELWMASTNIVALIDARRDDEEDDVHGVSHEEMVGDLLVDVTFFNPRSGEVEYQSLNARDFA